LGLGNCQVPFAFYFKFLSTDFTAKYFPNLEKQ
jgi:hypothetical protein